MGLREMQAAATRELILSTAFTLFAEQGYPATTMEEIASAAGIGTTTLYRYFPSKDLLITSPLELNGQMATEMRARPADEPIDVALGHAVNALMTTPRADAGRFAAIFDIVSSTPSLAARIYEAFANERVLLEQAIAERLGRDPDDLFCRATARMATTVVELVGERRNGDAVDVPSDQATAEQAQALLRDVLTRLRAEPPVLPTIPLS
ncbi:TetR/AcrR family transcriptional regulator [Williamsia sp. CHRR-6]|uniref:TetR/AcrR family transcriptional regulator n=1 Tax=Williamsia sp. CHRR-6 TaxID=2835871 RepID=UPI001BD9EAB0|nr:TetR/AcrR family transcriptional regulator [Williamsia sp. CHRR-6]MBT0567677.1 TetR family transcriptional regulator [Williamsia sp. CHRR-6]